MGQKIYVGNLSFNVTNDQLKAQFAQYGEVDSARIITDRDTGRSKGFGFVEMSNKSEAFEAIDALNGAQFEGRSLTVNEAKPMVPKDNRGSFSKYR
ncbi:MAG TPA: RNA-binding protein [Bacteriovoracaceae bacterium]|nr:RNA-binding protein [Bacteriovoracaceae bacterium]